MVVINDMAFGGFIVVEFMLFVLMLVIIFYKPSEVEVESTFMGITQKNTIKQDGDGISLKERTEPEPKTDGAATLGIVAGYILPIVMLLCGVAVVALSFQKNNALRLGLMMHAFLAFLTGGILFIFIIVGKTYEAETAVTMTDEMGMPLGVVQGKAKMHFDLAGGAVCGILLVFVFLGHALYNLYTVYNDDQQGTSTTEQPPAAPKKEAPKTTETPPQVVGHGHHSHHKKKEGNKEPVDVEKIEMEEKV